MLGYLSLANLWSLFTLVLDVGLLAIFIYYLLKFVRTNTRTIQIFKGVIFLFLLNGLAQILSLTTIEYFTSLFMTWGMVALVVVFQPEIRSILEKFGNTTVLSHFNSLSVNERERLVEELTKTCRALSNEKTGAIISIEQGHSLNDYIRTGTPMNSLVSSELLRSIFQYGTPLHDGAVIIQGNKIACASAYFPPTSKEFPSSYGARHRAAVGISEISDCITLIVSEETGNISVAKEGNLKKMSIDELREYLLRTICQNTIEEEKEEVNTFDRISEMASLKELFGERIDKNKVTEFGNRRKNARKKTNKEDVIAFEKIEAEEIVIVSNRKKSKKRTSSRKNKVEGGKE